MKIYDAIDATTVHLMVYGGALTAEGLAFMSNLLMAGNHLAQVVGPREAILGAASCAIGLAVNHAHALAKSDSDTYTS